MHADGLNPRVKPGDEGGRDPFALSRQGAREQEEIARGKA
jgi:hypothetical protein